MDPLSLVVAYLIIMVWIALHLSWRTDKKKHGK